MILKQSKNFIVLFEKRKSDAHDDAPTTVKILVD